jgi:hypothetical protein
LEGLTNGTEYDVYVVARNAVGDSSAASGWGTPNIPGLIELSASTGSVSPGGSVSFSITSDPNNLTAMFFNGVMPEGFFGPVWSVPNPTNWSMFPTCTDATVTLRIYDTTDISAPTWNTPYAASVDVTWVGDPSWEGCSSNQDSGGSSGIYKPSTPAKSDFTVTHTNNSVSVRANYSGDSLSAPSGYVVTLSPGGKTCDIPTPFSSCEIYDLNPNINYSVSILAKNQIGSSASVKIVDRFMPSIPGQYSLAGQKSITSFANNSAKLTTAIKIAINKFVKANPKQTAFSCTGYIAGKAKNGVVKKLAKARALAVCTYIKKLKPTATISIDAATPNSKAIAVNRKVVIRGFSAI